VILRLLTYNIRHGGRGREDRLLAVIGRCNPDVVVFQEATRPPVVERLAAGSSMPHWGAATGQSLGFMSRVAIAHQEWHRPRLSRHAFLEIVLAGTEFRVFGLHLSAVHAAWTERRRVRELRALLKSIERHQEGFHVLAGDFNTLAPGELLDIRQLPHRLRALVWLSGGAVRWRTIQIVLDAHYVDGFRMQHPDVPGFTFPTWRPHVRLDYVFVPAPYVDRLRSCDVVTGRDVVEASDHMPLLAEIHLPEIAEPRT
jgi:endonuclease/exonuclease/phosphatase family metal-dependent hydrolase